ncbi:MAG: hypothetical protein JNL22_10580 [Bacteroidales bacterium]|jgi:hypothetical protein|nr:hypothetical protein [Bacteroidales bacterium]
MSSKTGYAFFLTCLSLLLYGNTRAAADYEKITLRLYYEQKWDSLLMVGEDAIEKGYDYYYMRMRVGEAAMYRQRYVRAARHFEKALEFSKDDVAAMGLLYKSYRYSGRFAEAGWLRRKLPSGEDSGFGRIERRPAVYLETGPSFSNHVDQFEKYRQKDPGTYSEAYLNKNSQYFLAGTVIPLSYRLNVNVAAGLLNFNKNRRMDIAFVDSLSGDYSVLQYETYISPSFSISKKITISPAWRWVNVNLENPFTSADSLIQRFTGPSGNSSYNDYAVGGEISFTAPRWTFTTGAWKIRVDKSELIQYSGEFFYKPFGNLNLYSHTAVHYKISTDTANFIVYQMVGGRLFSNLWGEAYVSAGNLAGSAEHNAQVLYNSFDNITTRAGSRLIFSFSPYLSVFIRYQIFFREGTELFFPFDRPGEIFYYPYINQSITGGIKWNLH